MSKKRDLKNLMSSTLSTSQEKPKRRSQPKKTGNTAKKEKQEEPVKWVNLKVPDSVRDDFKLIAGIKKVKIYEYLAELAASEKQKALKELNS